MNEVEILSAIEPKATFRRSAALAILSSIEPRETVTYDATGTANGISLFYPVGVLRAVWSLADEFVESERSP